MKYAIIAALCLWAVVPGKLVAEAKTRVADAAFKARSTANRVPPVDTEHNGGDAGYVHGAHCIDGRAF